MRELLCLVSFLVLATGDAGFSAAGPHGAQASPGAPPDARSRTAAAPFSLTVDSVMRGPALVGYPPTDLRWSGDSSTLYFEWRTPGEPEAATWTVGREGGAPRRLSDEERRNAPPPNGLWDRDRRRVLAVQDGDVALVDTVARRRTQVTRTTAVEAAPRWARDETAVTFTRDNGVYLVSLGDADQKVVQLADASPKRPEPKLTESQTFLREEEKALLGAVKEAAGKRERDEAKKKALAVPRIELAEGQTIVDAQLAADGRTLWVLVAEKGADARTANVPSYVTESAYTEDIVSRTKVGDRQERRRLGLLALETGAWTWATLEVPGLDASAGAAAGTAQDAKPAPARRVTWRMPHFSDDGRFAVATVRASDNKDRWLAAIDPASGRGRAIDALHDDAWIREPGGFSAGPPQGFVPGTAAYYFLSERDGWMHLYSVDASGGAAARQLTSGRWEVDNVELTPDRRRFLITSTEVSPAERHLFTLPVDGGARVRVTTQAGAWDGRPSPDGSVIGAVHSYSNLPPEVYVGAFAPGASFARVTTSTSEEWRRGTWLDPQLVSFTARDGVQVPARLFTPEMLGAKRDPARPGVVFVHGAGYMQNVHRFWSAYSREYMFHHVLASRGYVVLDVDYRASAGYGRDWRTAIYRHMGGKDLEDVVDGAKYLASAQRVDPKRIGVYGGSYGGFITLMALFTTPDVFAAGAALRPVTDWAHYNHPYTSGILNEPQQDADAYRRSSPIYFAQNLKAALLICHGMVDTNVHFQDSVRLAQKLIELRKEHWELAVYPVENHGFEQETSWADEYRRVLKLFDEHLRGKRG